MLCLPTVCWCLLMYATVSHMGTDIISRFNGRESSLLLASRKVLKIIASSICQTICRLWEIKLCWKWAMYMHIFHKCM
jgi:hypothetical protein